MSSFTTIEDKKSESQKRINQHLHEARKAAYGSMNYATATVEELDNQKEVLDSIEDNLQNQEYLVDQSLRKIRGMTWAGTFYNTYTDIVSTIVPSTSAENSTVRDQDNKMNPSDEPYEQKVVSTSTTQATSELSEEDKMLNEISVAANSLKHLSVTMGKQLKESNEQIEKIEKKTEDVHDKTLNVTIKASQLTQKQSKKDHYIGTYQFMHISNCLLLSANGESLELTNNADLSTLFRVILRQETIIGLQNEATGKFVGITMFGSIAVSGNYLGSQEELFLEYNGNDSGVLFLAKNWGAGGWLKMPEVTEENKNQPIRLTETTSSAADKNGRILLKAIKSK
jgi:archaellum component FlaC